jgi:hypothetical protein
VKNLFIAIAFASVSLSPVMASPSAAIREIENALSIAQDLRRDDPRNSDLRILEENLLNALDELDGGSNGPGGYTAVRVANPALNIQCNEFNDPNDNAGGAVNVRNAIASATANVISQCQSDRGRRCSRNLVTLDFEHDGVYKCTVTAHLSN